MAATRLLETDQESLFTFASNATPGQCVELVLNPQDSESAARVRLTLAGFVDIKSSSPTLLTARLPSYEKGASISLDAAPNTLSQSQQWAAALATSGTDVALVDEDALLEQDGIENTPVACVPEGMAKRKPCKNCSCGLADMLDEEDKKAVEKPAPPAPEGKSGCGSCNLGDAFRCASCPYLGLPPFKPGEKVALPTSLMTSDI